MQDLHIGDFCKDTARILRLLYRRFPTKSALYMEDICGPQPKDDFGLYSPRHMTCWNTALWLAEEGLIRYTSLIRQEALDEAVLTLGGLNLLCHRDVKATSSTSVIDRIESLLSDASSDSLNAFILQQLRIFKP